MRLIIAGGRDIDLNTTDVECAIGVSGFKPTEIVSGNASGADAAGEEWAAANKVPCILFPADWKAFGRGAGPRRNAQMAAYGEALLLFWDGKSRGSRDILKRMLDYERPVYIVMKAGSAENGPPD